MSINTSWAQQLAQLLGEQLEVGQRLLEILREEKKAIAGSSPEELNRCGARKQAQLTRFGQLEQDRRLLCQVAGLGPDRQAMEQMIEELPAASAATIGAQWEQLKETIVLCRNANETNGLITQYKQRQVLQLLSVLRGNGTGNGVVYGANGTTALTGAHSRALAQV